MVRALLDFEGPWKIRELVRSSKTSTGSAYRVVEFLEAEALLALDDNGLLRVPVWRQLLRRWSQDYQFLTTNSVTRWIAPRGLGAFVDRVRDAGLRDYAVTGTIAAATGATYAPPRSAMVYSSDPERAAKAWGLRPTESGVNVILAKPAYDVLTERALEHGDGLRLAAPSQVAVDLMTGPGRAPSEAEELMEWMGGPSAVLEMTSKT